MKTKHFEMRCSQRNLDEITVNVVLEYGRSLPENRDRIIFAKNELRNIPEGKFSKKILLDIEKKIPICVVLDGKLITTFRIDKRVKRSKNQKRR